VSFYAVGFILLGAAAGMLVLSLDDGAPLGAIASCLFAAIGSLGLRGWLHRIQARPPAVAEPPTGRTRERVRSVRRPAWILGRWHRRG